MTYVLGVIGLVFLVFGAEWLVRGASRLSRTFGVSPLIIGLTVVAFGTSAPELAVSLQASIEGETELIVGNVVGSNIFNILLILGCSAMITPLFVATRLVRVDVPVMIVVSFGVLLLGLNGSLGRLEGSVLVLGLTAYLGYTLVQGRRGSGLLDEYATEYGAAARGLRAVAINVGLFAIGLLLLVVGARWLVSAAVEIALELGLSQLVVGLTIVSGGTSLPEVATSVVAAVKGERDIAVGNAVGSNIFNILSVLAITAVVSSTPITVPSAALNFDIPVMIVVAIACLPVFFNGIIGRWEGALFLGYYLAYIAYVILDAAGHDALEGFSTILAVFALPLTVLALSVSVLLEVRRRRRRSGRRQESGP